MPSLVAELNGGPMNLNATQASERLEPGTDRFTYSGGTSPLPGYTIKRGVGRGGFGEVYYALSDAGKEVAIKLIRRNLDVELRGVTQCLNLKHPNLVGLFDIRKDDYGDAWVVMEYVRGESLETAIDRHPEGMPDDQVLWWMHGICKGVAYLHDQGIVHRDLKPGNIFNDEGFVKVGDYGLSKFISASRRSGQTESVGTVHYMAPEIANGRYGKEIDIYSLGVILYEMLTGHVPFEGESVGEVLMKHLTAAPDVRRLREPFRTVVARALTKDPEKRYQSVSDLVRDLPGGDATQEPSVPQAIPVAPPLSPPQRVPAAAAARSPHAPPPEEPIWKAIRGGYESLKQKWDSPSFPMGLKILLVVGGIIALVYTSGLWMPAAILIVAVYFIYYAIRALILLGKYDPGPSSPLGAPQTAANQPASPRPIAAPPVVRLPAPRTCEPYRLNRRQQVLLLLLNKSPREKLTELLGSVLLSAAVVTAFSVLAVMLMGGQLVSDNTSHWRQIAWLSLVGIAGSWGIMIPAKLWETCEGEPFLRRLWLLMLGVGLGGFAYTLQHYLYLRLPDQWGLMGSFNLVDVRNVTDVSGSMQLNGYLAYFGFLFPVLRWWRQADPSRGSRFSLFATAICILWAWILHHAWPFPQPWGVLVAAAIAVGVQLSSPWVRDAEPRSVAHM